MTFMCTISCRARINADAWFCQTLSANSTPNPELRSHAAAAGPAHVPGRLFHACLLAQQLTEHPPGTNSVQLR